ncbi:uncharacterized protein DUF975 [Breznakia blatticola]|uniref:Uncharacterized protein DUF975 n=1 Tax=Breznakia blatticola TaxID=1754012 RepID=A0A4R7ZF80_9FIRM|nr:DUF975 family protein [Breznakia blatticola]TDW16259.1 uncharacterized protein DUF975 [Breznakia blatticola]
MFIRKELKEKAKKRLKGNLANIIALQFFSIVAFLGMYVFAFGMIASRNRQRGITILLSIGFILFLLYLSVVIMNMYVKYAKEEVYTFSDTKLKTVCMYALKNLVVGLLVCIGTITLFIPGIYLLYRYTFVRQIAVDQPNLGIIKTLRYSAELTKGIKLDIFALNLSFYFWQLLCVVTCGLAAFYVIPYVTMTNTVLYYELSIDEGNVTNEVREEHWKQGIE